MNTRSTGDPLLPLDLDIERRRRNQPIHMRSEGVLYVHQSTPHPDRPNQSNLIVDQNNLSIQHFDLEESAENEERSEHTQSTAENEERSEHTQSTADSDRTVARNPLNLNNLERSSTPPPTYQQAQEARAVSEDSVPRVMDELRTFLGRSVDELVLPDNIFDVKDTIDFWENALNEEVTTSQKKKQLIKALARWRSRPIVKNQLPDISTASYDELKQSLLRAVKQSDAQLLISPAKSDLRAAYRAATNILGASAPKETILEIISKHLTPEEKTQIELSDRDLDELIVILSRKKQQNELTVQANDDRITRNEIRALFQECLNENMESNLNAINRGNNRPSNPNQRLDGDLCDSHRRFGSKAFTCTRHCLMFDEDIYTQFNNRTRMFAKPQPKRNRRDYSRERNRRDYSRERNRKDYSRERNRRDYSRERSRKDYSRERNRRDHSQERKQVNNLESDSVSRLAEALLNKLNVRNEVNQVSVSRPINSNFRMDHP